MQSVFFSDTSVSVPGSASSAGDWIDLHTHSSASDGSDSPEMLLEKACGLGLSAIALCDHDTVSGLDEFLEAAGSRSITAVPGVEISTRLYQKELHIVGLFIHHRNGRLLEALESVRASREKRNKLMVAGLNAAGYDISYDEVAALAGGESVGRPHIAGLLIRKGYFQTFQDAFDHCLKRGTRTYVPRELMTPQEGIRLIHEAGGLAIWAHPIYRQTSERFFLRKFLKKLIAAGLDGVEAYYSMFSEEQRDLVCSVADELGLLISGGSDYHGTNQPGISLGSGCGNLKVPAFLLEKMKTRLRERDLI